MTRQPACSEAGAAAAAAAAGGGRGFNHKGNAVSLATHAQACSGMTFDPRQPCSLILWGCVARSLCHFAGTLGVLQQAL